MWRAELKKAIPTPRGDLEQAAALAHSLCAEPVEQDGHLGRRGKPARICAQIGERPAQGRELERRDVDQPSRSPRAALERREEVVDRAEPCPVGQHSHFLRALRTSASR